MLGFSSISRNAISALNEDFVNGGASMSANFNVDGDSNVTASGEATMDGNFTQTSSANRVREDEGELSFQFDESGFTPLVVKVGTADLVTLFDVTGQGAGTFGLGTLDITFSMTYTSDGEIMWSEVNSKENVETWTEIVTVS